MKPDPRHFDRMNELISRISAEAQGETLIDTAMACCTIMAVSINQMPKQHHEDLREAMLTLFDHVMDDIHDQ